MDEFYSDSLSDTPLARLADKAYLVTDGVLSEWPQDVIESDQKFE